MEVKRTRTLTCQQKKDIETILKECRKARPLTLSFPFEDMTEALLLYDPEPAAVLAVIRPEESSYEEPAECAAFTRPSRRREGFFSLLLNEILPEFEDRDLLFLSDHQDPDTEAALSAAGAEKACSELRMDLSLKEGLSFPEEELSPSLTCSRTEEDGSFLYAFSASSPEPVCLCRARISDTAACFYGFSVSRSLRGRGLGTRALHHVLSDLRNEGVSRVFLHVSENNRTAVRLYEKTGFRITETLSFYLY